MVRDTIVHTYIVFNTIPRIHVIPFVIGLYTSERTKEFNLLFVISKEDNRVHIVIVQVDKIVHHYLTKRRVRQTTFILVISVLFLVFLKVMSRLSNYVVKDTRI